jgi:hypothetical protein
MTCVLVLGRGRSGTSCISNILHEMGVNMGDRLKPSNVNNRKGFFEDLDFLELQMKMTDWRSPNVNQLDEHLMEEYINLIKQKEKQKLWGVKDPLLCFFFPIFNKICSSEILVINVNRNIIHSANSLVSRSYRWHETSTIIPFNEALHICKIYDEAKNKNLSVFKGKVLNLDFENLQKNTEQSIHELSCFLNLPINDKVLSVANPLLVHNNILKMFL